MNVKKPGVDQYLHNLVFSLFHSGQQNQEELSKIGNPTYQQKEKAAIPSRIMEMLLTKMEPRLTDEEKKFILNLLRDLGSGLKLDHAKDSLQKHKLPGADSRVFEGKTRIQINKTLLLIIMGDLIKMPVEAIVSPDNTKLYMDHGVSSIILLWGGGKIREEAQKNVGGKLNIGSVVVTKAGELPFKYILHTVIMEPRKEITRDNIRKALEEIFKRVDELNIKKIAFPAFGTATVKFPYDTCARVMLEFLIKNIQKRQESPLETVFITLYNREAYGCFIEQFNLLNEVYQLTVEKDEI